MPVKFLLLVFLNMITAQSQWPQTTLQGATVYAQAPIYSFPQTYAPIVQPSMVLPPAVKTAVSASTVALPVAPAVVVAPLPVVAEVKAEVKKPEAKAKDPKKEAEEAEKKRKAQWEAQQGIIDARIVDSARDIDVFGAGNLINGILTNPLVADTAIGVSGFAGDNAKVFRAGSLFTRVMSRRRVANSFQRQIDRYVDAHPEPTKTDYHTVTQWRAKRDKNNIIGDSAKTNMVAAFVPSSTPLFNGLSAVSSSFSDDANEQAQISARQALELAKDKFLKNTSDVSARQTYNQARDFREAKQYERKGTQAEKLNAVLPLVGSSKNSLLTQYGVLHQQKGFMVEKNIARRQLNLAEQKMEENPSEDNWWKVKLARATFDWRDQYEQMYRSRGLNTVANGLPSLYKTIFSASQTLRYKDLIDAQKRISRITLQMRKRDYAKKYEGVTDQTQQRFLALSTYGRPQPRPAF